MNTLVVVWLVALCSCASAGDIEDILEFKLKNSLGNQVFDVEVEKLFLPGEEFSVVLLSSEKFPATFTESLAQVIDGDLGIQGTVVEEFNVGHLRSLFGAVYNSYKVTLNGNQLRSRSAFLRTEFLPEVSLEVEDPY